MADILAAGPKDVSPQTRLPRKATHSEIWALMVMLAPILVLLNGLLRPGQVLFSGDIGSDWYPLTAAGMAQWRAGQVPLWTANLGAGFPLLAEGQGSLLYPLTVASHLVLPAVAAHHVIILVEVLIAALSMYALARRLGLARVASVLTTWTYVLAGPVLSNLGWLHGLVWWPLLFLFAENLSDPDRQGPWRTTATAAVVMGMGWLGGFPQPALFGVLAASGYLVYRTLTKPHGAGRYIWQPLARWTVAGLLGLGLGAVQLWPTLEMSQFSVRAGGIAFALAAQGSMFPTGLAGLLMPRWSQLSSFWLAGPNLYVGLAGLATAMLAWDRRVDRRAWFFWALAALACLLALGRFTPLYGLLYRLPGLSFLRVPARFLFWAQFSLAILLGMGFQRLSAKQPELGLLLGRLRRLLVLLLALAAAGCLGGAVLTQAMRQPILDLAMAYTRRSLVGQAYRLQGEDYYAARVTALYEVIRSALNPLTLEFLGQVVFALLALTILWLWTTQQQRAWWPRLALAACIGLELCLPGLVHPIQTTSTAALQAPALAQQLGSGSRPGRLYEFITQADIVNRGDRYSVLRPDYNLLFGIPHVGVYSPLGSRRYYDLLGPLGGVDLSFGLRPSSPQDLAARRPVLDLLGAAYVLSRQALNLPGFRLLQSEPFWLYENENRLPRALVVPAAQILPGSDAVLAAMSAPTFDPQSAVLLEAAPAASPMRGIASTPRVTDYRDTYVRLEANGPGWLLLSDLDYPGWNATLDGQLAPLYRADYVLRAVPLPTGPHVVEFRFTSSAFLRGALVAAVALLVVLVLWVGPLFLRRRDRLAASPLSP